MDAGRLPDRTTPGVFFRQAERSGPRTAIRHHDGEAWRALSWAGLAELVLRTAAGLVEAGVEFGDRVILMAENRLEWLYCDLAVQAVGGVTVPIYPSSPAALARQIVESAQARLAIAGGEVEAGRLEVERLIRMDLELPRWVAAEPPPQLLDEVFGRAARIRPDDLASIVYTSGTTGRPKGVALAHRNFVDIARCCLEAFDLGEEDVSLSWLPFSHVLERIDGIFVGVTAGAQTWLSRGLDQLAEDLQDCRPTVMVSVPRLYEKIHQRVLGAVREGPAHRRLLLRWALGAGRRRARGAFSPTHPLAERLVLAPLRARLAGGRLRMSVSGGAPLAGEVEEFFWAIGIPVLQGWGMTETSSGATSNTPAAHRLGTVGRPLPGVEVRLDADGEILVRGPGNMLGYHRDPEATAETLVEGWIRSGDLGEIDADGYLRLTDRKKDLIKTAGGKYVAPQPLEARLQRDPLIERAVVIGEARPYVTALVVPDWGALAATGIEGEPERLAADPRVAAAIARAVEAANRELPPWETVKRFRVLAQDLTESGGELTPTLKVRRKVVQERHAGLIAAMYGEVRPAPAGTR